MNTEIRKMDKNNIIYLRKIYLSVRQKTFNWINAVIFKETDFDKDTEGEQIYVVTVENKVVGFISVWEPDSFIHHLYIIPEYQNTGLGKLLLNYVINKLSMPISLKCLKLNIRGLSFYENSGWKAVDEGKDNLGEYVLLELKNK